MYRRSVALRIESDVGLIKAFFDDALLAVKYLLITYSNCIERNGIRSVTHTFTYAPTNVKENHVNYAAHATHMWWGHPSGRMP